MEYGNLKRDFTINSDFYSVHMISHAYLCRSKSFDFCTAVGGI